MATTKEKSKSDHRYKMADLVNKSGVSRDTIHYYISEGLLPAPTKSSRNMAWYSDVHLETLKKIKLLQQQRFLPLKAIKSVLNGTSDYKFDKHQIDFISALRDQLESTDDAQELKTIGLSSLEKEEQSGENRKLLDYVKPEHLQELQELGWISTKSPKAGSDDEKVVLLWAKLLSNGLYKLEAVTPKSLGYMQELVEKLFEEGLAFVDQYMSDMNEEEAAQITSRSHKTVTDLFTVLYRRRVKQFAEDFVETLNR